MQHIGMPRVTLLSREGLALIGVVLLAFGFAAARNRVEFNNAEALGNAEAQAEAESLGILATRVLTDRGGRLDWSHANGLIAFDRMNENRNYDIYVIRPDGTGEQCLTCDRKGLPGGHIGQPAWNPSGTHIVFQAERDGHPGRFISNFTTDPGRGAWNDLWIMKSDGSGRVQLTNPPATEKFGVLHPHFSPDGKKLSWSELYDGGSTFTKSTIVGHWKLKVADIVFAASGPRLVNIQTFQPGDEVIYENHGFSPDGTKLIFSSNFSKDRAVLTETDIYTLDLKNGTVRRLTSEAYNEHARYSPDGKRIYWMSTKDTNRGGTDLWVMRADGSFKTRLTRFNKRGSVEYASEKTIIADLSFSPDGKTLAAKVNTSLIYPDERILLFTLK